MHYFEELAPDVTVVGLREGLDDEAHNYRHARTQLSQHADLAAIYNIGGAPEGVARAVKEVGRERSVVLVRHVLTPGTRRLLLDGSMDAVLNQDPRETLLGAASVLANLQAGLEPLAGIPGIRTEIVLRENLP